MGTEKNQGTNAPLNLPQTVERAISLFPAGHRAAARTAIIRALRDIEDDPFVAERITAGGHVVVIVAADRGSVTLEWGAAQ